LTAKPGGRLDPEGFVQSIFLLGAAGMQTLDPRLIHIDMAARTGAGAAASRPQLNAPITNNLHDAPAIERRQSALLAVMVDDKKENSIRTRLSGSLFQGRPQRKKNYFLFEPTLQYLYRISFSSTGNFSRMRFLLNLSVPGLRRVDEIQSANASRMSPCRGRGGHGRSFMKA